MARWCPVRLTIGLPSKPARVRQRSFETGRMAGLSEGAAKLGWDKLATSPGLHRFMDHIHQEEKYPLAATCLAYAGRGA